MIRVTDKPASRILTRETVMYFQPCSEYRTRFEALFPVGVAVTVDLAVSMADKWDWRWAAEYLLSERGYWTWDFEDDAWLNEYFDTMRPWEDAYDQAWAAANTACAKARTEALDAGEDPQTARRRSVEVRDYALAPAQAAHEAAKKVALGRLYEARARKFAELYIAEGETRP